MLYRFEKIVMKTINSHLLLANSYILCYHNYSQILLRTIIILIFRKKSIKMIQSIYKIFTIGITLCELFLNQKQ